MCLSELIEAVARVRDFGDRKYTDPENWKHIAPERWHEALGVVVWLKARSLYRRSKAVLDALQSEETEVYEDDAETML